MPMLVYKSFSEATEDSNLIFNFDSCQSNSLILELIYISNEFDLNSSQKMCTTQI